MAFDLIVPLKRPSVGKSRLRGALGESMSDDDHAELVLALALDTLYAATSVAAVRRVLVVGSDPAALSELRGLDVDIVGEVGSDVVGRDAPDPRGTLNTALRAGERMLEMVDPDGVVGALQADLPALRPAELAAALAESVGRRSFVADRHGTGTTLLLAAPGAPLDPHFGTGSARAHARSGALALSAPLPSLRGDVDTPRDLQHARLLGLGQHTAALLDRVCLTS